MKYDPLESRYYTNLQAIPPLSSLLLSFISEISVIVYAV